MGKGPFSFRRSSSRRRLKKAPEGPLPPPPPMMIEASLSPNNQTANTSIAAASGTAGGGGAGGKAKKKTGGARLWMRFDRCGLSELLECDKNTIIKRAAIPARDLRILGPVFSHSSNILVASCFSSGILRNPERETNVEGGGFNSFSINC